MNTKFGFATLLAAACVHTSHAEISASYGWENGGTVLSTYSDLLSENTSEYFNSGESSLSLTEETSGGSTPNVGLAVITGLEEGDTISASFWALDFTEGTNASVRIWGHYTESDDFSSYKGSGGGNNTYSGSVGGVWEELSHDWVFDGRTDAFQIVARFYDGGGNLGPVFIDDISVSVSNANAQIIFPAAIPAPGALALLGLAGLGRRRRNG